MAEVVVAVDPNDDPYARLLVLVAREALAGEDGLEAINLRLVFRREFDVVAAVGALCEAGMLVVVNERLGREVDWRDGGLGARALMAHNDTVVRLDRGVDDDREGLV